MVMMVIATLKREILAFNSIDSIGGYSREIVIVIPSSPIARRPAVCYSDRDTHNQERVMRRKSEPLPVTPLARAAERARRDKEGWRRRYELDQQTMAENKVRAFSEERAAARDAEWVQIVARAGTVTQVRK
jgi:hypothetical protein